LISAEQVEFFLPLSKYLHKPVKRNEIAESDYKVNSIEIILMRDEHCFYDSFVEKLQICGLDT